MKWITLCALALIAGWMGFEVWVRRRRLYHDHYRAFLRQQAAKQRWKEMMETTTTDTRENGDA